VSFQWFEIGLPNCIDLLNGSGSVRDRIGERCPVSVVVLDVLGERHLPFQWIGVALAHGIGLFNNVKSMWQALTDLVNYVVLMCLLYVANISLTVSVLFSDRLTTCCLYVFAMWYL
jgi:hypothetical protein